jgi:hypothetical protein
MNFPRIAAAALGALVVYLGIGYLVHAALLADLAASLQRAGIARSPASIVSYAPIGMAGAIVASFAFAYAYAKGFEGGPGLQEGLRFGVLVGLIFVGFGTVKSYVTFELPTQYLTSVAVATVIQFAAAGMVVGLIYKKR